MLKRNIFSFLLLVLIVAACNPVKRSLTPTAETTPVRSSDDAADDPAIFVHPDNPEQSLIIGTDKQWGLQVYDLQGNLISEREIGRPNNVDLRADVPLGDERIILVGCSNRTTNTVDLFRLDPEEGTLKPIAAPIPSEVNEVYGFCLFREDNNIYAFVVGKDGVVEQYALRPLADASAFTAERVRRFDVGSQCEGMVADDVLGNLYIGEELVGVWKYKADPNASNEREKIVDISANKKLKADIEGITLYLLPEGRGYLIVSSQGNNSFAVYERRPPHRYLGSFRLSDRVTVDGAEDTDGIAASSFNLGDAYPKGVLVVQDGENKNGNEKRPQNFKLVRWDSIAQSFTPALEVE